MKAAGISSSGMSQPRRKVSASLHILAPNVTTLDRSGEEDAIAPDSSPQQVLLRRPRDPRLPLLLRRSESLPPGRLEGVLDLDDPPVLAPDKVAQPDQPDVVEVETADHVGAADLGEHVAVHLAVFGRLDEVRVVGVRDVVPDLRPAGLLPLALVGDVEVFLARQGAVRVRLPLGRPTAAVGSQ